MAPESAVRTMTERGVQNSFLKRKLLSLCLFSLVYLLLSGLAFLWTNWNIQNYEDLEYLGHERYSRDVELGEEFTLNCTPRSVDNFLGNYLSLEETQAGGVVSHVIISLYLIGALALVCDDYFVVSLERICDDLQMEADVAGATFMAVGSSAAEFFTSVIGVFIAKSDVGVGTIVGSAIFNLLFIIGVCGLFAGVVVQLTWWPVFRDITYYLFSVLALVLVIQDGLVSWWESLILVLMCVVYFVILGYNRKFEKSAHLLLYKLRTCCCRSRDEDVESTTPLLTDKDTSGSPTSTTDNSTFSTEVDMRSTESGSVNESDKMTMRISPEDSSMSLPHHQSPWLFPESWGRRIFWILMLPVKLLLYLTVPDCRRKTSWKKLYLVTFTMSVVWIAVFSYVLVWMVTIAGDALEIPDTVMGLTLLSAGTSVPDCLSSLYVARDGLGDMAVSNSIASNVFNILMCLGLPWLLETAAVNTGEHVSITSGALVYDTIILLTTVAFLIIALFANRWKLNGKLGIFCMFAYFIVTAVSCLFELNVFGELNMPSCPR